jgi:hypothetical protein
MMRKAHFFMKIIFKGLDIQCDGSKKGSTPDVIYPVIAAVTVPIFTLAPSYIPGGRRSFWKLIELLLVVVGFLIVLWLICVGLRWIIEKLVAAFRRK